MFSIPIEVVNRAAQPAHVLIAVQGLPNEWLDRRVIGLDMEAYERRMLRLTIAIPKIPQSGAGSRVFGMQVGCLHAPASVLRFSLILEVAEFSSWTASFNQGPDPDNPNYNIIIANCGNTADS